MVAPVVDVKTAAELDAALANAPVVRFFGGTAETGESELEFFSTAIDFFCS